jgi:hypothetical protein
MPKTAFSFTPREGIGIGPLRKKIIENLSINRNIFCPVLNIMMMIISEG